MVVLKLLDNSAQGLTPMERFTTHRVERRMLVQYGKTRSCRRSLEHLGPDRLYRRHFRKVPRIYRLLCNRYGKVIPACDPEIGPMVSPAEIFLYGTPQSGRQTACVSRRTDLIVDNL